MYRFGMMRFLEGIAKSSIYIYIYIWKFITLSFGSMTSVCSTMLLLKQGPMNYLINLGQYSYVLQCQKRFIPHKPKPCSFTCYSWYFNSHVFFFKIYVLKSAHIRYHHPKSRHTIYVGLTDIK